MYSKFESYTSGMPHILDFCGMRTLIKLSRVSRLLNHTVKPLILTKNKNIKIQVQIDENLFPIHNANIIQLLYTNHNLYDRINKPYNKTKIICNFIKPYTVNSNNWIEPLFFHIYTPIHILGFQVLFTPFTITNKESCVTLSTSIDKSFKLHCSYTNECKQINGVEIEMNTICKYRLDWKLLLILTTCVVNGHIFVPLYIILSYKIAEITCDYCHDDWHYEKRYVDW